MICGTPGVLYLHFDLIHSTIWTGTKSCHIHVTFEGTDDSLLGNILRLFKVLSI